MEVLLFGVGVMLWSAFKNRSAAPSAPPPAKAPAPKQDTGGAGDLLAEAGGLGAAIAAGALVGNAIQGLYSKDNDVSKVAAPIVGAAGGAALFAVYMIAGCNPVFIWALPITVLVMAVIAEFNAVEDDSRWARFWAAYQDVYASVGGDPEGAFTKAVKYFTDDKITGLGFRVSAELVLDKAIFFEDATGKTLPPVTSRQLLDAAYGQGQAAGDAMAAKLAQRFPYVFVDGFTRNLARLAAIKAARDALAAWVQKRSGVTDIAAWQRTYDELRAKVDSLVGLTPELKAEFVSQSAWDKALAKRRAAVSRKVDPSGDAGGGGDDYVPPTTYRPPGTTSTPTPAPAPVPMVIGTLGTIAPITSKLTTSGGIPIVLAPPKAVIV